MGGSLAGLMAAIALRDAGCDVQVFERVPRRLEAQGAGLRIVPEMARLLEQRARIDLSQASTRTRWFRQVGPGNRLVSDQAIAGQFTSWGTLHRALSAAADPIPYRLDQGCTGITEATEGVQLQFASGRRERADLAVFADGILSTGRRLLSPATPMTYAGYVTWRGFVPEAALSAGARAVFADAVTYAIIDYSHMIVYPIPDPAAASGVLYNFVWYRNVPGGPPLDDLMTDRSGTLRPISLPAGALQDRHAAALKADAQRLLPEAAAEIVVKTEQPFLQALYDVAVPRMAFGHACLLGDAAFATRPHAGAATTKAAVDAWSLADSLAASSGDVVAALEAWEPAQLAVGVAFLARNRAMGDLSLVQNRFDLGNPAVLPGLYGPGR